MTRGTVASPSSSCSSARPWPGSGPCQGGACLPHVRAWIAAKTGDVPDPFTARPASRQITLAEASADTYVDAFRRTPLHDEHLAARGADGPVRWLVAAVALRRCGRRVLGRPRGRLDRRRDDARASWSSSGPDVVELLERLYPCHVADIKPGRSRYALLLNERGHVMDDGMILRESETRFVLSFTSGGAANAEMWIRDWIDVVGPPRPRPRPDDVARRDQRHGAARGDAARARRPAPIRPASSATSAPTSPASRATSCACRSPARPPSSSTTRSIARSSCGGRSSTSARDLGIRPHGLQALFGLRLEKGHVIVGMDTELDTTPRRLGMDWAVRMEKPRFIGRAALERTAKLPDHRRWVGFTMDGPAPAEGAPIWSRRRGRRQRDGELDLAAARQGADARLAPADAVPDDRSRSTAARRVVTPTPFYDPEGHRARA